MSVYKNNNYIFLKKRKTHTLKLAYLSFEPPTCHYFCPLSCHGFLRIRMKSINETETGKRMDNLYAHKQVINLYCLIIQIKRI